jgi:DNA mismatch repair protein MSH5
MRQENFAAAMHVSRGTQRALQVFQLDAHPLGHGCGAAKEGLSLYGILCRTRSVAGGRLMRAWVASPSTELGVIEERQAVVALLRSPAQDAAFAALVDSLRGVKNVPAILRRLQTVTAGVTDWEGLEKSARALLSVHDALRALHAGEPELGSTSLYRRFLEVDAAALRDAVKWISSVLDFPESKAAGRLVVADGFSEDIDAMRECYAGLDEFLTRVGVQEMNRITDSTPLRIPRLQLVYLPQVGYLILLDHHFLATPAASDGMLSAGGLEFMFSSPEHGGYFKNERCCVLDAEVGDIHGALIDLEAKAVRYLETKVLPSASAIYQASGVAAELDCLAAFAAAANEYNWVRPVFDPHGHGLHIEHGRHALQELIIPSFIPNSMAARGGDVHVVTGPNCSGKSVFCKQVALIAILAHVGSCVPAQSCRLGIIDTIYTRIASHESVSLNQSSFFIDASQVAGMLRGADERSLVLLDEWGKGTNETDGMALFAATLSELLRRPADRAPICLAATHFTELLADPFLPMSSTRLGVFSMDVLVEAAGHGANRLDDRTVYLYRVVPGSLRGESRAIHCAQTAGVPREVLMRSIEVRSAVQRNAPLEAAPESTRLARITAAVRAFLEADLGSDTFDVRDFLSTLPL